VVPGDGYENDGHLISTTNAGASSAASNDTIAHIYHAINVYSTNGTHFDRTQTLTLASMLRAKQYSTKLNVHLVCAIFEEDVPILLQHYDDSIEYFILRRSTLETYPNITPKMKLPFVSEIFETSKRIMMTKRRQDQQQQRSLFVFTNSDIGVNETFYDRVWEYSSSNSWDSFTINRRIIPDNAATTDLDVIYRDLMPRGQFHPGYDCFVVSHDLMRDEAAFNLGDMFVGYPPWGRALNAQLEARGEEKHHRYLSDVNLTFHMGQDRSWGEENLPQSAVMIPSKEQRDAMTGCIPSLWKREFSHHRYQNTCNCAKAFHDLNERRQQASSSNTTSLNDEGG